jgi:transposase
MAGNWLGIDVAKEKFDAVLLEAEGRQHYRSFANQEVGFIALAKWLKRQQVASLHACLEATGTYGLALANYLHRAGIKVSVVNPACIKAFAQSELKRTKTDRVDAGVIARFCRAMAPTPWQPPAEEMAQLQALLRRLESLQEMLTAEKNRLQTPGLTEAVQASLQRTVELLEEEIARLEREIAEHIKQHPTLQQKRDLLTSIQGIGEKTANLILSEMGQINFTRARQAAAYAGLVPQERRSGSSVRGKARLSKRGNRRLRKALYWPAVVAMRYNPLLKEFAARLKAAGKPTMVIIGAIMRKLIHLAFGVLKSNQPFNPNYHCAKA